MTYAEKRKDPKWQKRRLDRLNAADWKCERCGDKKTTLHVHHRYYMKGRDPWDYPDFCLEVLCEDCHSIEHAPLEPDEEGGITEWEEIANSLFQGGTSDPALWEFHVLFASLHDKGPNRACLPAMLKALVDVWKQQRPEEPVPLHASPYLEFVMDGRPLQG